MELGFEDCDQYSRELIQAMDFLADLEENGVEALNPRPLSYPPDNPEETLQAVIQKTRQEIDDYRRTLTECAQRYLAEKGW